VKVTLRWHATAQQGKDFSRVNVTGAYNTTNEQTGRYWT